MTKEDLLVLIALLEKLLGQSAVTGAAGGDMELREAIEKLKKESKSWK